MEQLPLIPQLIVGTMGQGEESSTLEFINTIVSVITPIPYVVAAQRIPFRQSW
jgi:hypothetical protein